MMTNKKIIEYLKLLRILEPDKNWFWISKTALEKFIKENPIKEEASGFLVFLRAPRFATVLLVLILVFGLGAGTIFASQDSLPGDNLYPVKLVSEKTQEFLTLNNSQKIKLHTRLANRRLEEIEKLINQGKSNGDMNKTLARFEYEVEAGKTLLEKTPIKDINNKDVLNTALNLKNNLVKHQEVLDWASKMVPETVQPAIDQAKGVSARGEKVALKMITIIESKDNSAGEDGEEIKDNGDITEQTCRIIREEPYLEECYKEDHQILENNDQQDSSSFQEEWKGSEGRQIFKYGE